MSETPTAEVEVVFLSASDGGRRVLPQLSRGAYRPHFRSPGTEDMLGVEFLPCADHVSTHSPIRAIVRFLYHPSVNYEALEPGAEFEIVEGPHVVGRGRVVAR